MRGGRDPRSGAAAAARDLGGDTDAPIVLVDPDPAWPRRFAAERTRLAPLLPGAEIQHVGSTAVADLPAKPVIDVMALVDDLDASVGTLVTRADYLFPEAFNAELDGRRWLCRPSAAHRTHHLHLVVDRAVLDAHLRFRDRLRASARLRAAYARLKRELAATSGGREAYGAGKTTFVDGVLDDGPPRLTVGVGASRDCPEEELAELVDRALAELGRGAEHVRDVASVDAKGDEPAVLALAAALGAPLRLWPAATLAEVPVPTPSAVVRRAVGTPSVAEAAALATAGPTATLLAAKRRSAAATCALALADDDTEPPR